MKSSLMVNGDKRRTSQKKGNQLKLKKKCGREVRRKRDMRNMKDDDTHVTSGYLCGYEGELKL